METEGPRIVAEDDGTVRTFPGPLQEVPNDRIADPRVRQSVAIRKSEDAAQYTHDTRMRILGSLVMTGIAIVALLISRNRAGNWGDVFSAFSFTGGAVFVPVWFKLVLPIVFLWLTVKAGPSLSDMAAEDYGKMVPEPMAFGIPEYRFVAGVILLGLLAQLLLIGPQPGDARKKALSECENRVPGFSWTDTERCMWDKGYTDYSSNEKRQWNE
jgi:hypothetical protein